MDTVTYPDDSVREITRAFVCIRVDHDGSPPLVEKYRVEPLPDLRLLDPEGKELAHLVGFTSASRLVAECRRAFDLLTGKPGAESTGRETAPVRTVEATPQAIDAAVTKGTEYLRSAARKGWKEVDPGMGPEELVLLAWTMGGPLRDDADAAKLVERILAQPLAGTYQAALRALALAHLDAAQFRPRLQECAKFLLEGQLKNGQWTYGPPGLGVAERGDNSNTAYALLGLAACRAGGVEIPAAPVRAAEAWWRGAQNADGGWGYRSDRETHSYASMTESGWSSLLLCRKLLGGGMEADPACDRAAAWLKEHFSVSENVASAYQHGRELYHLYALERLGSLTGTDALAGHDWYREGASFLLGTQREDGSWDDGADTPVPNTCFVLLFLKRATTFVRW